MPASTHCVSENGEHIDQNNGLDFQDVDACKAAGGTSLVVYRCYEAQLALESSYDTLTCLTQRNQWVDACCKEDEVWTCADRYTVRLLSSEYPEIADMEFIAWEYQCVQYICGECYTEGLFYIAPDINNQYGEVPLGDISPETYESSPSMCQERCARHPECSYFTFYEALSGMCLLFTSSAQSVIYWSTAAMGSPFGGDPISGPRACSTGNQSFAACSTSNATCISEDSLSPYNADAMDEMREFMHLHNYSGFVSKYISAPIDGSCSNGSVLVQGLAYFPNATGTVTWCVPPVNALLHNQDWN
eukprot:gene1986-2671_t